MDPVEPVKPTNEVQIKKGNLINATEQYIVQQCCITAVKPHGLSATIARRFPSACPYARRRPISAKRNFAVHKDQPQPGTIIVLGRRPVISLFGQVEMGRPGAYNRGVDIPDSSEDRIGYFKAGLAEIAKLEPKSLAFPFRIGCGLAGGHWPTYQKVLEDFAAQMPTTRVVLYMN